MGIERITGYTVDWRNEQKGSLSLTLEDLREHTIEISSPDEMNALTNQLNNQPHCYFNTNDKTLIFTIEPRR